jgi:hypothetical protein
MHTGRIATLNWSAKSRQFHGFIFSDSARTESSTDSRYFFHQNDFIQGTDLNDVTVGDDVVFTAQPPRQREKQYVATGIAIVKKRELNVPRS